MKNITKVLVKDEESGESWYEYGHKLMPDVRLKCVELDAGKKAVIADNLMFDDVEKAIAFLMDIRVMGRLSLEEKYLTYETWYFANKEDDMGNFEGVFLDCEKALEEYQRKKSANKTISSFETAIKHLS